MVHWPLWSFVVGLLAVLLLASGKAAHHGQDLKVHLCLNMKVYTCLEMEVHICPDMKIHICPDMKVYMCPDVDVHICQDVEEYICTDVEVYMWTRCGRILMHRCGSLRCWDPTVPFKGYLQWQKAFNSLHASECFPPSHGAYTKAKPEPVEGISHPSIHK